LNILRGEFQEFIKGDYRVWVIIQLMIVIDGSFFKFKIDNDLVTYLFKGGAEVYES